MKKSPAINEADKSNDVQPIHKKMELIANKIPLLRAHIEKVLTKNYRNFVKDIALVAPKPSTFSVTLRNGFEIYFSYIGDNTFSVKISGKTYNLANAGEVQRAANSMSRLLTIKNKPKPQSMGDPNDPSSMLGGGGGSFGGGDPLSGGFEGGDGPLPGMDDLPGTNDVSSGTTGGNTGSDTSGGGQGIFTPLDNSKPQ